MKHKCYRCKVPQLRKEEATPENINQKRYASLEHIIPNFCGGMITSWSLLCAKCNNELGSELDSALDDQLLLHKLFTFRRDRGSQPDKFVTAFTQDTKTEVLVNRNLEWKRPNKPKIELDRDGRPERILCRDEKEMRTILAGFKRKFPDIDIDEYMKRFKMVDEFIDEKIDFSHFEIGGPLIERAIAKIAVNYYLYQGGDSESISDVVDYVSKPGVQNIFTTFYYSFSQIHSLGPKEISHLIFLKGTPINGLLYCYIELFSTVNFLVILSRTYKNEAFTSTYCYEVNLGIEIPDKKVKLSLFEDPFEWLKYQHEHSKHQKETAEYFKEKVTRALEIYQEMVYDQSESNEDDGRVLIKSPSECTATELEHFRELVLSCKQVSEVGLTSRISRCQFLGFFYFKEKLVAVSAIKQKSKQSVHQIFERAKIEGDTEPSLELGYSCTHIDFRGRGINRRINNLLLSKVNREAIFSTTGNDRMKKYLLDVGFRKRGQSFEGVYNETLEYYERPVIDKLGN